MAILTSLDEVVATLGPSTERRIIGIAGSPGAGKSTIGEALVTRLGPAATLLPMDGFHLPQAELVRLGRRERMGAPDTFDVAGFVATLAALHLPGPVSAPDFDRVVEEPIPAGITIPAEALTVVVEGNYLLLRSGGWEKVAPLLTTTFFVVVEHDIRVARLVERHVRFGKSPANARAWALGPDESNARLIEATAGLADHRIRLG